MIRFRVDHNDIRNDRQAYNKQESFFSKYGERCIPEARSLAFKAKEVGFVNLKYVYVYVYVYGREKSRFDDEFIDELHGVWVDSDHR